jgi:dCTP diphosphatase
MSDRDRFDTLTDSIRQFVRERDWEQFHSPKNLILALVGELGARSRTAVARTR